MSFGVGQLLEIINKAPNPWDDLLRIVLIISGIVLLLLGSIKFVPQGQWAMRTRFGKVVISRKTGKPIILGPGIHWFFPKFYSIEGISVLDYTFRFGPTQVRYSRFDVANVSATATFAVRDIYALKYRVNELEERVSSACEAALRRILLRLPDPRIDDYPDLIRAWFLVETIWMEQELGVEFKDLDITKFEFDGQFTTAGAIHYHGQQVAKLGGLFDAFTKS